MSILFLIKTPLNPTTQPILLSDECILFRNTFFFIYISKRYKYDFKVETEETELLHII